MATPSDGRIAKRPRTGPARAILAVLLLVLAGRPAGADRPAQALIDRVLALVDGAIVTLSDVEASLELGLVRPPKDSDPIRAALDHAIDRQLMLNEVERYAAPEPDPAYIDLRLATIRARFPSTAAFAAALARRGLDGTNLRALLRNDLRIEQYLRDRFSAVIQPTEDEMRRYYAEHRDEFTRDGRVLPYEDVAAEIGERLLELRRADVIADWLARLRQRAIVRDLYGTNKEAGGRPDRVR